MKMTVKFGNDGKVKIKLEGDDGRETGYREVIKGLKMQFIETLNRFLFALNDKGEQSFDDWLKANDSNEWVREVKKYRDGVY